MPSTYKIRDTATGLFSTGGSIPGWTKSGKTWSTMGALKSHLTLYMEGYDPERGHYKARQVPLTWEIVEYVAIENGVQSARAVADRPAKR